jgi:hypothetical protein
MRTSPLPLWLGVVMTAALLTGCSTTDTPDAADATSTASPTVTPTPSATPTEAPAPAEPMVCETLVGDEDEAKYAAAGWTLTPGFGPLAEPRPLRDIPSLGGIVCQWGVPSTDSADVYAYSPLTPAQAEAQRARLTAEGYAASEALGGTVYETHGDDYGLPYDFHFLIVDGAWYYSSVSLEVLEGVRRNVEAATTP